jgi:hypothetical protein
MLGEPNLIESRGCNELADVHFRILPGSGAYKRKRVGAFLYLPILPKFTPEIELLVCLAIRGGMDAMRINGDRPTE